MAYQFQLDCQLCGHRWDAGKYGAVGIGFKVARLWENHTRLKERRLKRSGGASRYCPLCRCGSNGAVANEGACQ